MVFMEGKQQMIDLIGALQVKRQREQTEEDRKEDRKRKDLENEMMELANEANKHKQMLIENITAYKGPGSGLNEPLGWAKYERERNVDKALSAITGNPLPNVGIRGLGGGGGGGGQTSDDENRIASAQADLAEENARIAQYQRQGRGGGGQPQQAPKGGGNLSQMLGLGGPNIDEGALRQSVMSGQGIQSPEGYSAGWDRDRNIADATRAAALEREKFLLGGGAMSDKIVPPEMQVDALARKQGERNDSLASKGQATRDSELRKMRLSQLKGDTMSGFDKLAPELQQATLDMNNDDRKRLFDIVGKATKEQKDKLASLLPNIVGRLNPGDKINWGEIISVLSGK